MKVEEDGDREMTDSDTPSHNSTAGHLKNDKAGIATVVRSTSPDRLQGPRPTSTLDRKESYKAQRKSYAKEKKRVEKELLSTFKDESIVVLADWLKVRGSLKSWTKLWCVLKPGLLFLYKSPKTKSSHWIGTIILSTCELIERPSKKDGFCFKLFHPMDQSIWASRGPEGEAMGAVVQPLPTSHLIFRAPNNAAGKCWMDALELALRCSSLLLRTMSASPGTVNASTNSNRLSKLHFNLPSGNGLSSSSPAAGKTCAEDEEQNCDRDRCDNPSNIPDSFNESDVEKHFKSDLDDGGSVDDDVRPEDEYGNDEMEGDDEADEGSDSDGRLHPQTKAVDDGSGDARNLNSSCELVTVYEKDPNQEVFGDAGDQTEEISDENKSIVWFLVKQVRPGMDLSKVVLPTFILEPRSFLDKISDYYYHADILSEAVKDDSPFSRIKTVVRWYLSGFYKKPKGLKKPYNPILGERFRCYWQHQNGSKTFYVAEQVSHHPPISAFYVTNRQEGFTISSSVLAKSRFYGNSTSAILDGVATLSLLPRGEDYKLTMPYAHCKGILMGTMTMELGGKVYVECEKTGYSAELEFKLRPFLGGGEFTNAISGKIKLGKEVMATLGGHWDDTVMIKEKKTEVDRVLWVVNEEVRLKRLPRFTVPLDDQEDFESVKLWRKVSAAIGSDDQVVATEEKSKLEELQRAKARNMKVENVTWQPRCFELDASSGQYVYVHSDARPWDPLNDVYTYELDYVLCTKTRHQTPVVRALSILSISDENSDQGASSPSIKGDQDGARPGMLEVRSSYGVRRRSGAMVGRQKLLTKTPLVASTLVKETKCKDAFDHKKANSPRLVPGSVGDQAVDDIDKDSLLLRLEEYFLPLQEQTRILDGRLSRLQLTLDHLLRNQREGHSNSPSYCVMFLLVILTVISQAVLNWVLSRAHQFSTPIDPPGQN